MTSENDAPAKDRLDKLLSFFEMEKEETVAKCTKEIAETDAVMERVEARIQSAKVGSPEWERWRDLRDSFYRRNERRFDLMINAITHYILALDIAIVGEMALNKETPALAEEAERMKEELRKTVNDQIAKKVAGLFSEEGHEAMYGHA